MENEQWLELYKMLPYNLRCQAQHFLINLIGQARDKGHNLDGIEKLGSIISDDFDDPMKEFHDYMYNIDIAFIDKIEKLKLADQRKIETIVDEMLLKTEITES